jgi:hypothetical protein
MDTPSEKSSPRLSPVLIHLLKGVFYQDQQPAIWSDLLDLEARVVDYFQAIGLELQLDKAAGFAYLKQAPVDEEDGMPRLIQRRPLSYPISVLCVLLRKKLAEADAGGGGTRVVLGRDQIVDMMRIFAPTRTNEAFTVDQIESYIAKATDMGLLKPLKTDPPAYEVRPVVKALVDGSWLSDLDQKIKDYQDHGNGAA